MCLFSYGFHISICDLLNISDKNVIRTSAFQSGMAILRKLAFSADISLEALVRASPSMWKVIRSSKHWISLTS